MGHDYESQNQPNVGSDTLVPKLPALGSLLRKAAVDAGFDLEPEIDNGWWRLRSSGAPGVAWVRPMEGAEGAWIALPLVEQLAIAEGGLSSPLGLDERNRGPVIPLGAAGTFALASPESIHDALRRVWTHRAYTPERMRARLEQEVSTILSALDQSVTSVGATEAVAEVRRRVGQDLFREALLELWEGRCAVTDLDVPELLRASHAKPWADATDAERLDVHNGLLLAVHLDALFDRGFLTFGEQGRGMWSPALPESAIVSLGLTSVAPSLRRVSPSHEPYLAWHRARVFRA